MGQRLSSPITDKNTTGGANEYLVYGAPSMQGWRIHMEDNYTAILDLKHTGIAFFGVYDGHRGEKASLYTSSELHNIIRYKRSFDKGDYEQAIKDGYLTIDKDLGRQIDIGFEDPDPSGCTATTALITKNEIYIGNVGDSRAVLSSKCKAIPLSEDHKPFNKTEFARIVAAGGRVRFGRINGDLALSRAIGDFDYKENHNLKPEEQIITALPEVHKHNINPNDEFIVIASDGIWDCYSSQEVISFVAEQIAENKELEMICELLMEKCIASDPDTTYIGCDNMTIIIIGLLQGYDKNKWRATVQSHVEETKQNGVFKNAENDSEHDDECENTFINLTIEDK